MQVIIRPTGGTDGALPIPGSPREVGTYVQCNQQEWRCRPIAGRKSGLVMELWRVVSGECEEMSHHRRRCVINCVVVSVQALGSDVGLLLAAAVRRLGW
jgi:hypothetical protein